MDAKHAAAEARVGTARAQRYLGQMCKHFAHRCQVAQDGALGRIEFAGGICELEPAPRTRWS